MYLSAATALIRFSCLSFDHLVAGLLTGVMTGVAAEGIKENIAVAIESDSVMPLDADLGRIEVASVASFERAVVLGTA